MQTGDRPKVRLTDREIEGIVRGRKVYLAGPMRGLPYYNFPAFMELHELCQELRADRVYNPAQMDIDEVSFDGRLCPPDTDWTQVPAGFDFEACVTRDLAAIRQCDVVLVLPGGEGSVGLAAELAVARWLGKPMQHIELPADTGVVSGEVRTVDPDTGAQKGQKLARFDLIPAGPLWELAEHFGRGAQKYADRNWEKGYAWSKTFAACLRHLWQFWRGEDLDPETGSKHVICAAWHCFAMAEYMTTHPAKDDRPDRPDRPPRPGRTHPPYARDRLLR